MFAQSSEANSLSVIGKGDPYNNIGLTDGEEECILKIYLV